MEEEHSWEVAHSESQVQMEAADVLTPGEVDLLVEAMCEMGA
jgi:hypothetical protein